MEKTELKRIIKLENKINKIVTDMGFPFIPIEWDIIPEEKMWEILAYRAPTQISNWKFGRDYERQRTIFENYSNHLPYECVIYGDPCRAYLMKSNVFAVQVLVMAHVVGHSVFFKENKMFEKARIDLGTVLAEANSRVTEYEKLYGIDEVEKTIDAGHAIQMHSSPFATETEDEKRVRVYNQMKEMYKPRKSDFADVILGDPNEVLDVERYNRNLMRTLKMTTPVEPTEDLLRYIIDNSSALEDWQKDILEVIRYEGQYYWPIIRTKYMNEGFACFIHERVMDQLFHEGDLTPEEHGQYNYSNSLVKAQNKMSMNPYLIGSHIWKTIETRWDKGQHGSDWKDCTDFKKKEEWDTKEMGGLAKIKDVLPTYTDWMFFQDFLTDDVIEKLDLFIYYEQEYPDGTIDYIRTGHSLDEIKQIIINSFSNSGIPKIEVVDGNANDGAGHLLLNHVYSGAPLDRQYCEETMKHICYLWGRDVYLKTVSQGKDMMAHVSRKK